MKIISGVPEGYDALMLAKLAKEHGNVLHIALSDVRLAWLAEGIKFFAPDIEVLIFPAWDTVPYDRVSPNINIISERVSTLAKLTASPKPSTPRVVLTTVNASLQRLPPKEFFAGASFAIKVGADINLAALQSFLDKNGANLEQNQRVAKKSNTFLDSNDREYSAEELSAMFEDLKED